jgi:hypothetical protein
MVTYLVSEECKLTHEIFSAGGGRFARFFVGMTPGKYLSNEGEIATPEQVLAAIEKIRNPVGYTIHTSLTDELQVLVEALESDGSASSQFIGDRKGTQNAQF